MSENTLNPFGPLAQDQSNLLRNFIEASKKEIVVSASPSDAHPLDQARDIVMGHSASTEFFENTSKLYQAILGRGVDIAQARTYFFSTGIDLALRTLPFPFLSAASNLMKRLLSSSDLDELARSVGQIFDPPEEMLDNAINCARKATRANRPKEKAAKEKLRELLKKRSLMVGLEFSAFAEGLKDLGFSEDHIPGYLLAMGFMAGQITKRSLPPPHPYG